MNDFQTIPPGEMAIRRCGSSKMFCDGVCSKCGISRYITSDHVVERTTNGYTSSSTAYAYTPDGTVYVER